LALSAALMAVQLVAFHEFGGGVGGETVVAFAFVAILTLTLLISRLGRSL